jgi:ABC-2 type transport system ATP-binding protein
LRIASEPTEGWATINGTPAAELTDRERQRIGYLPQIPALFPELSLWENVSVHASMYGLRFVAVAASFVHDPPILFLDEPTAGIDPIRRAKFWEWFRELRQDGGRTIFVTTQYVGEASYCDEIGLLSDGGLLAVETPDDLREPL